jgi:hypothetical protein
MLPEIDASRAKQPNLVDASMPICRTSHQEHQDVISPFISSFHANKLLCFLSYRFQGSDQNHMHKFPRHAVTTQQVKHPQNITTISSLTDSDPISIPKIQQIPLLAKITLYPSLSRTTV